MSPSNFVRRRFAPSALALALCLGVPGVALPAIAQSPAAATVDIPYETFTLPNGLRVVVHTDRKAPIVAVNVWYHVGSKNEPAGRTGFAHLFEHLMFQGSENYEGEFFEPFTQVGATSMNGTTWLDRTNYFQNVPTTALDMALWMESDRMGHFAGAITQALLDEQRGVVQNEKRQGDNQPYGLTWYQISEALHPVGHPYRHSTIGSMNDLNAASIEDAKQWFRAWYGPNNAVLVLAGDIDLATAKEKVTRYFGDIPAGPTLAQPQLDVVKRAADTREVVQDKVPQARVHKAWIVAPNGTADVDRLELFSRILGGARTSRLDARLLHQDKLVDGVRTYIYPFELHSIFFIEADVKQGVEPERVEAIIDEELQRLIAEGPTADELSRAQTAVRASFIRGVERIGGFGGKADALAACAVYQGDPGCFRATQANLASATPADIQAVGRTWLGTGRHTLVVEPGQRTPLAEEPAVTPAAFALPAPDPRFTTTPGTVDRSLGVPKTETFPELKFPALQRATLRNGTTVILAQRHEVPVVQFSYEFLGGYAADHGAKPGTASFTMGLLDEGAAGLGPLQFAEKAEALGANLGAGASHDGGSAFLSALKENLDPSLALFADMLRRPDFAQAEVDRIKASWIAGIRQEKAQPMALASRLSPQLLFGADHPYGVPGTGSGTEAAIAALTRDDLLAFHRKWVRPENASLIVVGDTTLEEIVPLLERHFGDWKGEGAAPTRVAVPEVALPAAPRVFLVDQPGAVQANIFAGQVVPSTTDPGAVRLDVANGVIGGGFTARLNMNLREDKGWSYGARAQMQAALGQRNWWAGAPVQIDRTDDSIAEMQREITAFASGEAPATLVEINRVKAEQTLSLPGAYETAASVRNAIGGIVLYGRPDDYVARRKAEIESMTPEQVNAAAKTLQPGVLTWLVVGDLAQIEAPVRALNLGEVTILDADGNPVEK